MENQEIEALYMTPDEVAEYLDVVKSRVYHLRDARLIVALKGGMYSAQSVKEYKAHRLSRKGGRPKNV